MTDRIVGDLNKTPLTHQVTEAARQWLLNHGFKPVEAEVPVTDSWIADLAGVIDPTQTELIELRMIPRPPRYKYGLGSVNDGYHQKLEAWRAALQPLLFRTMTALIEVKTSRSDFRGDRKWKLTPPTDLSWLAVAPGILSPDEWPAGWGILEQRGDVLCHLRPPVPIQPSKEDQFRVIYSLAVRQHNRIAHANLAASAKRWRIEAAERRNTGRFRDVVCALEDIAAGYYRTNRQPVAGVEEALRHHGITSVYPYLLKKLEDAITAFRTQRSLPVSDSAAATQSPVTSN